MYRMVTFTVATDSVEFAIFVYATNFWAAIWVAIAAGVSATLLRLLIVLGLGPFAWRPHLGSPLPHPERPLPHPERACDLLNRIRRSLGVTGEHSNRKPEV